MTKFNLNALPTDIIKHEIMHYLDDNDIYNLNIVSNDHIKKVTDERARQHTKRQFNEVIKDIEYRYDESRCITCFDFFGGCSEYYFEGEAFEHAFYPSRLSENKHIQKKIISELWIKNKKNQCKDFRDFVEWEGNYLSKKRTRKRFFDSDPDSDSDLD